MMSQKLQIEKRKQPIFKICAHFTDCIMEINNTKLEKSKDLDVGMAMCNWIEYSDKCSKTSASLYQFFRDEPNDNIT